MKKEKKFLSDLKLYSDYLGWNEKEGRYETWDEAVESVLDTHREYYSDKVEELEPYLKKVEHLYKNKDLLASQRTLQFRSKDLFKNHFRSYNCCVLYADKPSFLGNAFLALLSGTGVGVNMMLPFVNRLGEVVSRTKGTKVFNVEDSVEGWADAAHVLIASYCTKPIEGFAEYQGYKIIFDFSRVRPRGAKVGRRFKAPGPEALEKALINIENLLNRYVEDFPKPFQSIIAYDCFMHLSDAVLSGGVRRAASSIIISPEDEELVNAKVGNWREKNRQRERSNNSVGLLRNQFSKEEFLEFLKKNDGMSDLGFVFLNNIYEILNPCFEIGFTPISFDYSNQDLVARIMASDPTVLDEPGVETGLQLCNLCEGNAASCSTPEKFLEICEGLAIIGTLQAGYTKFHGLKDCLEATIKITEYESLLGCSFTGWANQPWLFENPELLAQGAELVKKTNELIANIIGIRSSARSTCVKPSGNASVILGCASGIHPEHSQRYFRVMQLNKLTETAQYLESHMPFLLENSIYSATGTDYVVFVPIENKEKVFVKEELVGINHLEYIKRVQQNWVIPGKRAEASIIPTTSHNVSNTVIIDNYEEIGTYLFDNQGDFTAVSFITAFGDKDYAQAPFTSVLTLEEIVAKYGKGAIFASGLIVDGLQYFGNNLWEACNAVTYQEIDISSTREVTILRKDWIRRAKNFAKNFFKGDLQQMVYCLKDVHLYHKWETIKRDFKDVDFTKILKEPTYLELDTMGAQACHGGACEIVNLGK